MHEKLRLVEEPRICSYLPDETASLEFRCITQMSATEYADLLARGYRRSGWQLFRPACASCDKCRSVRVLVRDFEPDAGERRVIRKNANIRAELHPLSVSCEHVELYNLYHQFMSEHRGWPLQRTSVNSYCSEFLSGPAHLGKQWLYFDGGKLVGVALMDEVPDAVSLVYCFYDPCWRARSPGIFSVLNQLLYAKESGLRYAYLGYWIESSQSMSYKGRFYPREVLREYPRDGDAPVWLEDS